LVGLLLVGLVTSKIVYLYPPPNQSTLSPQVVVLNCHDKANSNELRVMCDNVLLLCNNESAMKIAHNPVQHSKMNHIEVYHHFIQEHVNRGGIN
jgi:hypothetical protein